MSVVRCHTKSRPLLAAFLFVAYNRLDLPFAFLQDKSPDKLQTPEFRLMGTLILHDAWNDGLCRYWA
jgi:hypothetical protein